MFGNVKSLRELFEESRREADANRRKRDEPPHRGTPNGLSRRKEWPSRSPAAVPPALRSVAVVGSRSGRAISTSTRFEYVRGFLSSVNRMNCTDPAYPIGMYCVACLKGLE